MLKIAEGIDLKELEKFGFKKYKNKYVIDSDKRLMPSEEHRLNKHYSYIIHQNRKIEITKNTNIVGNENKFDTLYDLIQAGIVVKE